MESLTQGRSKHLPRQICLGLHVTILVKQVPPSMIAGLLHKSAIAVWDYQNLTIWIDKTVSLARKWEAYRHELIHAIIDTDTTERGGI